MRARLVRVVDEVVAAHHHELEAALTAYQHAMRAALTEHHRELEGALTAEINRAIKALHEVEFRSRRDLWAAGEREAAVSSERFARNMMPTARAFDHSIATLEYALSLAPADGMALEFGVYQGRTLKVIAEARKHNQVFGFDSFQGLPEDWRSNIPAGTFATEQLPDVVGAELVVGWFDDTLAEFLADHPGPVAFLHLDADLYSSTATVLEQVGPRLGAGSVIVFDEYFNYPGWEQHEHRAWQEFVEKTGIMFRYAAYACNNEQVAVVVTGTPQ
ncbi:MAG: class I SAM-dependent methyltransferase [Pseudonocardiales bacterium]|nr:class I SAM-dependent methyltransferase [Pseudonocardiales bacterium]